MKLTRRDVDIKLNIKKILLPVDFPNASLRVLHQAAMLGRHFHSQIVLLHVVTARSHAAGVPDGPESAGWDLLAAVLSEAERNLDRTLRPELDGVSLRCLRSEAIRCRRFCARLGQKWPT
jgi:nucleotide-binding universal stress UspA family protein